MASSGRMSRIRFGKSFGTSGTFQKNCTFFIYETLACLCLRCFASQVPCESLCFHNMQLFGVAHIANKFLQSFLNMPVAPFGTHNNALRAITILIYKNVFSGQAIRKFNGFFHPIPLSESVFGRVPSQWHCH